MPDQTRPVEQITRDVLRLREDILKLHKEIDRLREQKKKAGGVDLELSSWNELQKAGNAMMESVRLLIARSRNGG